MKPKQNNKNSLKFTKTAKAALPFFALFGGQGFASSRNPFSLQSSRKVAGKSVVYIHDTQIPTVPVLAVKKNQQTNSPFTAFTNKVVSRSIKTHIDSQKQAMEFLNDNNLLSSDNTTLANLSGNTNSSKTFSDDWQWSTRLSNSAPFTANSTVITTCVPNATYNSLSMGYFLGRYYFDSFQSYTCAALNIAGTAGNFITYDPSADNILGVCQAIHMACDGQPLPVELQKFEIK